MIRLFCYCARPRKKENRGKPQATFNFLPMNKSLNWKTYTHTHTLRGENPTHNIFRVQIRMPLMGIKEERFSLLWPLLLLFAFGIRVKWAFKSLRWFQSLHCSVTCSDVTFRLSKRFTFCQVPRSCSESSVDSSISPFNPPNKFPHQLNEVTNVRAYHKL